MTSYFPPKKATVYTFFVSLASQANPLAFQANPTLATGDVKVRTDGGSLANITTLPSVVGGGTQVQVDLSAAEMNGDNIWVQFIDAAGAEWCDLCVLVTGTDGAWLASTGLDSISTTAPTGVASNFREMLVQTWRRFFKKATKTSTQIKTYADDGTTVITTQTVSDTSGTETQGTAT